MAEKSKKERKASVKYKAVNPSNFKAWYSETVPGYSELSKGESVELDAKNKHVINWLDNKIIIKE